MSLRALKGRGNPPLRAQRGNLNLFYAVQPVPSKAKESSSLLAMTLE
jgi:hypothetical protein